MTALPEWYLNSEVIPPLSALNLVVAIADTSDTPRKINPGMDIKPPPVEIAPTVPESRPIKNAPRISIQPNDNKSDS